MSYPIQMMLARHIDATCDEDDAEKALEGIFQEVGEDTASLLLFLMFMGMTEEEAIDWMTVITMKLAADSMDGWEIDLVLEE